MYRPPPPRQSPRALPPPPPTHPPTHPPLTPLLRNAVQQHGGEWANILKLSASALFLTLRFAVLGAGVYRKWYRRAFIALAHRGLVTRPAECCVGFERPHSARREYVAPSLPRTRAPLSSLFPPPARLSDAEADSDTGPEKAVRARSFVAF